MERPSNISRVTSFLKRPITWLLAAWVFSFVILLARTVPVSGDGIYYYAYLRSIVLDHDVDFSNDLEPFTAGANANPHVIKQLESGVTTPTGLTPNLFSIGPTLVWSPFFVVAHGIARVTGAVGLTGAIADGFTPIELLSPSVATSVYGLIGLLFAYGAVHTALPRALEEKRKQKIAAFAALAIFLGTNLSYYLTFEASMSHGVGFFAVSALVWAWQRWRSTNTTEQEVKTGRTVTRWLLIGLLAGLAVSIRWQLLAVVLILPGLDLGFRTLGSILQKKWREVRTGIMNIAVVLLGGALALAPQVIAWRHLYGSWLVIPQGAGFLDWTSPHALEVLFSSRHGLFTWTPLVILAVFSLVLTLVQRKKIAKHSSLLVIGAVIIFLLQTYINGAAIEWWGGDAFGARRFTDISVIFMFGLAFLFARTTRIWAQRTVAIAVFVLIAINLLFMQTYRHNPISHSESVSLQQAVSGAAALFK